MVVEEPLPDWPDPTSAPTPGQTWCTTTFEKNEFKEDQEFEIDSSSPEFPNPTAIISDKYSQGKSINGVDYDFYSFSNPPSLIDIDQLPDKINGQITEGPVNATTSPCSICEPCDELLAWASSEIPDWTKLGESYLPGSPVNAKYGFSILWKRVSPHPTAPLTVDSAMLEEIIDVPVRKKTTPYSRFRSGSSSCLCVYSP